MTFNEHLICRLDTLIYDAHRRHLPAPSRPTTAPTWGGTIPIATGINPTPNSSPPSPAADTANANVVCWRDPADNVAEPLTKGARVIVTEHRGADEGRSAPGGGHPQGGTSYDEEPF